MPQTIYIEEALLKHPRVLEICHRFKNATIIPCHHYGEIFNRKAQNFRLQKQQPALILAEKRNQIVMDAPRSYGIGGSHNFYFSHMLNCLYDCRYCFLQGMYRSAHYVVFINYEDFDREIENKIYELGDTDSYFYSGYDCDSLAYDAVTQFTEHYLPLFRRHPRAFVELRTKSTQITALLNTEPFDNAIIAFSFTPDEISKTLEQGVPSLEKRLKAMRTLQQQGWRIGLRFDPMIYHEDFQQQYATLLKILMGDDKIGIDASLLHSVSLGPMRLPKSFYQNIVKLYPDEKLFAGSFEEQPLAQTIHQNGQAGQEGQADHKKSAGPMATYPQDIEQAMLRYCETELLKYIPADIYYPCIESNPDAGIETAIETTT